MSKTKQSYTDTPLQTNPNFLKFCYLLAVLLLFSCKEAPKGEKTELAEPKEVTEETVATTNKKVILFFGDSLTAGYGLDDTKDAYPGVIQTKIDSLGYPYEVVNAGLSGETTAGGLGRINWILAQDISVFVLELGANDGLRGTALSETKSNLQGIIDAVRKKDANIPIVLTGMQLPPNMGKDYTTKFSQLFKDLADKNDLVLVPFLLENVGGVAQLNQADGIHPTAAGHQILANNVWLYLKPILEQ
ncbi:arylesterase [Croceivirga radicis]|uniref:arylesterase n=1 Tax=Croceivirga radicis TaxID=1929488 RepID=UPI000255AF45|nr:arylesterase [Croceivirga radicis]